MKKLTTIGMLCLYLMINTTYAAKQTYHNDDIIYEAGMLPEYTCLVFKNKASKRRFFKKAKIVLKVYPYARVAGIRLMACELELSKMSEEQLNVNKKKYYKEVEKTIKAEFDGQMRKLTIREGQVLIKLIDRECNRTGYYLIKDLRNGFTAWSYQQFAKFCGTDLRRSYDPNGEDEDIELILRYYSKQLGIPE